MHTDPISFLWSMEKKDILAREIAEDLSSDKEPFWPLQAVAVAYMMTLWGKTKTL